MSKKSDGSVIIDVELKNDDFKKKIKALKKDTEASLEGLTDAVEDLDDAVDDLGKTGGQTANELKPLDDKLQQTSDSSDDVTESFRKTESAAQRLGSVASKAFTALTTGVTALSGVVIKMGVDFESAFAGVEKTVDASAEELAGFRERIRDLSKEIPLAATEIAGIAEAAGQLGIKNENLIEFTRTMADLGVATNMTSDQAATSLARFANVAGMSQDQFDRLGSVIVDLGNNLATSESEIVDMGMKLVGAGTQLHLSEAQILGMAGALSSVGIEAEAGGTAFSTLMSKMQLAVETGNGSLKDFAQIAGMSAGDFKKAFKEDAAGAIIAFVQGLKEANEKGESSIKVLDDMGITEVRMRDALLRASGASDLFAKSMDTASEAWEKNIALTEEANKRYDTTESKLTLLQNSLSDTAISAYDKFREPFRKAIEGGIKAIDELQDSLENGKLGATVDELAKEMSSFAESGINLGSKAIPPLLDCFNFILRNGKQISVLVGGIFVSGKVQQASNSWNSVVKVLDKMSDRTKKNASQLSGYQIIVGLVTRKVELATAKQKLWNTVMSPKGITLMITAVAALCVGLAKYADSLDSDMKLARESIDVLKKQKERIEDLTKARDDQFEQSLLEIENTEKLVKQLDGLVDAEGNVIGDKEKTLDLIKKINDLHPDLMLSYDEETGKIVDQDGAVKDLSGSLQDMITLKKLSAWIDANQDIYTQTLKDQNELLQKNIELQKKISWGEPFMDEYNEIIFTVEGDTAIYEALDTLAKKYGTTRDEMINYANSYGGLKKALADNEEQMLANKETVTEFDGAIQALEEKNYDVANQILSGIGIEQFDMTRGIEQVDLMVERLDTLKERIKTLEELNKKNPELYGDELQAARDAYNAQLSEINIAQRELGIEGAGKYSAGFQEGLEEIAIDPECVVDKDTLSESGITDGITYEEGFQEGVEEATPELDLEENVEDMTAQGETDGTAYGEADKEARVEKSTEAAEESKKVAIEKTNEAAEGIVSVIKNMKLPDKFVSIYAKYIGFDKIPGGGSGSEVSAYSDYSMENVPLTASIMGNVRGIMQDEGAISRSKATVNTAKSMASTNGSQISAAKESLQILVQNPSQNSGNRPIQQTINFNQPIERPSQVSRAIEKTAKDLNKKGRM